MRSTESPQSHTTLSLWHHYVIIPRSHVKTFITFGAIRLANRQPDIHTFLAEVVNACKWNTSFQKVYSSWYISSIVCVGLRRTASSERTVIFSDEWGPVNANKKNVKFGYEYSKGYFLVQVRIRTEGLSTPSSTWPGFKLMISRSWPYISCHWDACS